MELIFRQKGEPAINVNGHWKVYDDDRVKIFIPGAWHTEHFSSPRKAYQLLWCTIFEQSMIFHLTAYTPGKGYSSSNKRLSLNPPMIRSLWEKSTDYRLATSAILQAEFHYLLMVALCFFIHNTHLISTNTDVFHEHVIEHLKAYIEGHYWEELTLGGLAGVFHYSPKHLNALFKQNTGTPLLQHISALRMQKSRELLASGTLLVKQAAEAVGIHDPLYFSKKFRQHFGCTPQSVIPLL
jgi:AraC-like DNA-binding protein